jgi:hypothetical protein
MLVGVMIRSWGNGKHILVSQSIEAVTPSKGRNTSLASLSIKAGVDWPARWSSAQQLRLVSTWTCRPVASPASSSFASLPSSLTDVQTK